MDIPGSLPLEVFHKILMYLPRRDLHNTWKCCKKWRNRMQSWKIKCMLEGYFESEDDLESEFYRNFVAKYSKWEGIYKYNYMLENNWITQKFKEITVNCGIEQITPYYDIRYFGGDIIVITLENNKILVIDCTTGSVKQTFYLPGSKRNKIRKVGKSDNRLTVVSEIIDYDENYGVELYAQRIHFQVWNIETGDSLTEFQLKIKSVFKILINKDLVTILSHFNTARIINMKEKTVVYYRSGVTSIHQCCDKIAMGTEMGTVSVMDLDYTHLMTFNCFESDRRISDIEIKGNYLVGFTRNKNCTPAYQACICNIATKTKLYHVDKLWNNDLGIYANENKLVYLCPDGEYGELIILKYCHLDSGECIFTYYKYDVMWSSNEFFILHKLLHGSLKLWSIKTENDVANMILPKATPYHLDRIWNTKSKLAYFDYNRRKYFQYLKIINFEATIVM